MKSSFFYEGHQEDVANSIKEFLNSTPEFLSPQTVSSTRATGDAIEDLIERFRNFRTTWEEKEDVWA